LELLPLEGTFETELREPFTKCLRSNCSNGVCWKIWSLAAKFRAQK
jgi:hypothetical protein